MHSGLTNFEHKSVDIITQNGGDVLEIGFGMGISANRIISKSISSYTCVEINDYIIQDAVNWSLDKTNVTIIQDGWENYLDTTQDKFDAIYCDYIEFDEYPIFFEKAKNVLKVGGIISVFGSGIYFGSENMNIVDSIEQPNIFDDDFTSQIFNNLLLKNYYKVYWQYFDGTNFVKTLG
jgi:spermidine synthase